MTIFWSDLSLGQNIPSSCSNSTSRHIFRFLRPRRRECCTNRENRLRIEWSVDQTKIHDFQNFRYRSRPKIDRFSPNQDQILIIWVNISMCAKFYPNRSTLIWACNRRLPPLIKDKVLFFEKIVKQMKNNNWQEKWCKIAGIQCSNVF